MRTSPTVPVIAVAGLSLLAVGAGAGAASAAQRPAITNSQPESIRALMAERGAPLVTDTKGTAASRKRDRRDGPPMSAAAVRANDIKQQWAKAFLRNAARSAGVTPDTASSLYLAANRQAQQRSYWCGPAAASEAMGQMGYTKSQATMASKLGTTTSGTDWSNSSGYPMPNALNAEGDRNYYVAVGLPGSPTSGEIATYKSNLVEDINFNGGVPLIGDAVMVFDGPRLAGVPNVSYAIYHWFDIRGYAGSGATTYYEDSAFTAYGDQSSSSVATIVGSRGYDW